MKRGLTCAEIEGAVEAARIKLSRDAPTARTLERLVNAMVNHVTDPSDGLASFNSDDEELPLLAEVDEAIAEVCDREIGLARQHVGALKKAREMLAQEVKRRAAEEKAVGGEFITRKEFSSFAVAVACALSDLESASRRAGFSDGDLRVRLRDRIVTSSRERGAAVESLLSLLDDIREADGIRDRRRAQGRAHAVGGANGRNW